MFVSERYMFVSFFCIKCLTVFLCCKVVLTLLNQREEDSIINHHVGNKKNEPRTQQTSDGAANEDQKHDREQDTMTKQCKHEKRINSKQQTYHTT